MNRNSFVFYASFYEAIKEMPREIQGEIYTAIIEYGLYGKETENLKQIAKAMFTLIKPQLDANTRRYENGCKGAEHGKKGGRPPKEKTVKNPTKTPNDNDNEKEKENVKERDTNVSEKKNKEEDSSSLQAPETDYDRFNTWIKDNAPYCANPKNFSKQISQTAFASLKKLYTGSQIADIILQIENRKDLRKRYTDLNRTVSNWAKKEYGK